MSARNCTTHHYACDCREERFRQLQDLMEFVIEHIDPGKEVYTDRFARRRRWVKLRTLARTQYKKIVAGHGVGWKDVFSTSSQEQ